MKIEYHTNSAKSIYIQSGGGILSLRPEETLTTAEENKNDVMRVFTQQTYKINFWRLIRLFLRRVVLNLVNVVLMNFSETWFNELDPFILSASYQTASQTMTINYVPAYISKPCFNVIKPRLTVNDKPVNAQIELDLNSISAAFFKYCFDIISFWIYGVSLITVIFACSGKFAELLFVFIVIVAGLTLPVILKIFKINYEKKRLVAVLINDQRKMPGDSKTISNSK